MSDVKGGKRSSADADDSSRKKSRKEDGADAKFNPYLAHMYDNGSNGNEPSPDSPLAGMKRHQTTAKEAEKAEDSEYNPFTGRPHSQKYFQILEGRRDLPVHKQRFVLSLPSARAFARERLNPSRATLLTSHLQARVPQKVPREPDPCLCR